MANILNCYYCTQIKSVMPDYRVRSAVFDLGSNAPRCSQHWRFICASCGRSAHFMASGYCSSTNKFFCSDCASDRKVVNEPFLAWRYYFLYLSPWTNEWCPSLDRLEFEGMHPLLDNATPTVNSAISSEQHLVRYPLQQRRWHIENNLVDANVRDNWNANAVSWNASIGDEGDDNRRYLSDQVMLEMLGEVRELEVLDVGCGNGYLCRKLAKLGAYMTGIDLSESMIEIARRNESQELLRIKYIQHSATNMSTIDSASFDRVVSNYVLMDVLDHLAVLQEIHRVLRPGGGGVIVISHPCFFCGPASWDFSAPDSPRYEDRIGYRVDKYFQRGPIMSDAWQGFNPVLSYHRTLSDYWQAFNQTGFRLDCFKEPSISELGREKLCSWNLDEVQRIPYSCAFQLTKIE